MAAIQQVLASLKPAGGGPAPSYYYSFTPGTGTTGDATSQWAKTYSNGGIITGLPSGTITEVGVYVGSVNYGTNVELGVLNGSRTPIAYAGSVFGGGGGWAYATGLSIPFSGGNLHVAVMLTPGAPYDGAMGGEYKALGTGGIFGNDAYSGAWPVGFTFGDSANVFLVSVKI